MHFPAITHFLTGVAVPVFSLRSELSCGVGEFADLPLLGAWCQRNGLDLIQILPVNDTGADPSPYNARSAFALNPIYLRLQDIPGSEDFSREIEAAARHFGGAEGLQYAKVLQFKMEILQRIFEHCRPEILNDEVLREWVKRSSWLGPYARVLGKEGTSFTEWVQFHLERQLHAAALKLDSMGIALKGDIPILLSADSADVRNNPTLFNTRLRVGAPPDVFSTEGQNWRFPSFRWDEMERDGFAWWRDRIAQASQFYHAYRIDHVLGFFRTWLIPEDHPSAIRGFYEPAIRITAAQFAQVGIDASALSELVQAAVLIEREDGFAPAWYWHRSPAFQGLDRQVASEVRSLIEAYWTGQESLWRERGRALLRGVVKASDMLVCGEDLGVVPHCVPEVLEELGILGLRVDRWAGTDDTFCDPGSLPQLTVTTTSTHDSSTLRGWWQEAGWNREKYFAALNVDGTCPAYLTTEVCAAIVERNMNSNSLLVVLPLQDLFALHYDLRTLEPADERINIPGTESEQNWSYRMKGTLESLLSYDRYNEYVRAIVSRRRMRPLGTTDRTVAAS